MVYRTTKFDVNNSKIEKANTKVLSILCLKVHMGNLKVSIVFYISLVCNLGVAEDGFLQENSREYSPVRRNKPKEAKSEFCDYLPGVKLSDQDSLNLCSFDQLAHLSGQWVRRHNNCNMKEWYDNLDPMGLSTIYEVNKTDEKFECHEQERMKNIVGNRHRFSPSGCSLLRFNQGHATEMVNDPCLSPILFLGDKMMENLAASWKFLVGVKEGEIEYRYLSKLEPLDWVDSMEKFKTIIISVQLFYS